MNDRGSFVLNVNSLNDINNIPKHIKYINLNINNPNRDIISYFKEHGQNYFYADSCNTGYIYVDYDTFLKGQNLIDSIINSISSEFNKFEISRFLYIALGKRIGYDINIIPEKNDIFSFYNINKVNNIWGSICNLVGSNLSFCKLYSYLCRLVGIDNEIITVNDLSYKKNKLVIDDKTFIVDITRDIPFIESEFKTRFFGNYNDNLELDKKIGYISNNYVDKILEDNLSKIDFSNGEYVLNVLNISQNILDISNIKPIELGIIYEDIFNKFCPNRNIVINNLYINGYMHKEHFILISNNNKHYSYNYKYSKFMNVDENDIVDNLNNGKIGLYLNELIPNISFVEKNRSLN